MPAETMSDEVSHLMRHGPSKGPRKGKKYGQRQAVAATMSMARRGDFGKKAKRKASRIKRRRG